MEWSEEIMQIIVTLTLSYDVADFFNSKALLLYLNIEISEIQFV